MERRQGGGWKEGNWDREGRVLIAQNGDVKGDEGRTRIRNHEAERHGDGPLLQQTEGSVRSFGSDLRQLLKCCRVTSCPQAQ